MTTELLCLQPEWAIFRDDFRDLIWGKTLTMDKNLTRRTQDLADVQIVIFRIKLFSKIMLIWIMLIWIIPPKYMSKLDDLSIPEIKIYSDDDDIPSFTEIFVNICIYKKRKNPCGELQNIVGINVPRRRFLPVKTSSDLLLIMSNLYSLKNGFLEMNPKRSFPSVPLVKLGNHFKKVRNFYWCLFECLFELSFSSKYRPSQLDFN